MQPARTLFVLLIALILVTPGTVASANQFIEPWPDDPPTEVKPAQPAPRRSSPPPPASAQAARQEDMLVNVCASHFRGADYVLFHHICPFAVFVAFCMTSANVYEYTCESALTRNTVQISYLPIGSRAQVSVVGGGVVFKACAEPRVPRLMKPVGTFGPSAIWTCQ
jgi:hypothetical protein